MIIKPNYIFSYSNNDNTIVYNTYTHLIFKFNKTAALILGCFEKINSMELSDIIYHIARKTNSEIETISSNIAYSVNYLISEGILIQINNTDTSFEANCINDSVSAGNLYSVLFELTYKCNEKCRYCYINKSDIPELQLPQIKSILREIRQSGVFNIVFTGGDVFVRNDFIEIFQEAQQLGFLIDIYTNGLLCDDTKVVEIARRHPRSVHFSLYSLNPKIHDDFTQIKGSWEKTLSVAKKFIELGVAVNFKINVLNINYTEIVSMIDFVNSIGATAQIGTVVKANRNGSKETYKYRLDDEIAKEYLPIIYKKLNKEYNVEVARRNCNSRICGAGLTSVSINPYGKVFLCNSFQLEIGDLTKSPFKQIIKTSPALLKWKELRWGDVEKCSNCGMGNICSFCPGQAFEENENYLQGYDSGCIGTEIILDYIKKNKKEI